MGLPVLNTPRPSVFNEVQLGPLIGRGAYGRVFKATWNGNTVAVKVMRTDNPELFAVQGPTGRVHKAGLFEAALSSSLSHPNVANTYAYAVRPVDSVVRVRGAPGALRLRRAWDHGGNAGGRARVTWADVWLGRRGGETLSGMPGSRPRPTATPHTGPGGGTAARATCIARR